MTLLDEKWKLDSNRYANAAYAIGISWDKLRETSIDKMIAGQKDPNKSQWDKLENWLKETFKGPVETIVNSTDEVT